MAVCLLLVATLVVCTVVVSPITAVLAPVIAGLLAAELDRSGHLVAVRVVRVASLLLPKNIRGDHADEWIDQVLCDGEAGLRPVLSAICIAVFAAPRIAVRRRLLGKLLTYVVCLLAASTDFFQVQRRDPPKHGARAVWAALRYALGWTGLAVLTFVSRRRLLGYFASGDSLRRLRHLAPVIGGAFWAGAFAIQFSGLGTLVLSQTADLVYGATVGLFAGLMCGAGKAAAANPNILQRQLTALENVVLWLGIKSGTFDGLHDQ
ncbi:MAG TPA: hypothetical protein VMD09_15935 [Solirubrobacteraceae bacterium]|nr:hypothetical protein [Solirubrobacteraceae bacterium]